MRPHPPVRRPGRHPARRPATTPSCAASCSSSGRRPQEALLAALKPYLRPERREKLDRAMRIARISQIAGGALKQHGGLLGGPNDV